MRRTALLIYTGLMLACFSGCHFHWWHHKHHKAVEYTDFDACGCDTAVAAPMPIDSGPVALSHIVSSSPGVIPGPPSGYVPGPPGAAALAPAGTKVLTPK
jgi:hypothetical protein